MRRLCPRIPVLPNTNCKAMKENQNENKNENEIQKMSEGWPAQAEDYQKMINKSQVLFLAAITTPCNSKKKKSPALGLLLFAPRCCSQNLPLGVSNTNSDWPVRPRVDPWAVKASPAVIRSTQENTTPSRGVSADSAALSRRETLA